MDSTTTTPNWYADPTGRHQLRLWDGHHWSDRVIDIDDLWGVRPRPPPGRAAGWLPDPMHRHPYRYYDGSRWTGDVLLEDPVVPAEAPPTLPPRPADPVEELAHLRYLQEFVGRCPDDVLDDDGRERLLRAADARVSEVRAALAGPAKPRVPPAVPRLHPPAPHPTAPARARAPVTAPSPAPVAYSVAPWRRDLARWAERTRAAVRSDLAVHGLAYLGVLLLFAGVFGFVAFAFGEVERNLRPLAEVAIPLALFGAARFLRTRGAPFVAVALEVLGGAVVPIVVIAAFVDGADVPPDLTGGALCVMLAGSMLAVAGVYARVSSRRPSSPLRYVVGPVIWVGVAMGALVTVPGFSGGQSVTTLQPWPMAITALSVLATAAVTSRQHAALARAVDATVLPGLAVVIGFEIATAATHGWPVWPSFVTALAGFGTVELEQRRLGSRIATPIQSAALAGALAALVPEIGEAWAGALAVPTYLAFLEWTGPRRADPVTVPATLPPAGVGLLLAMGSPGATITGFAIATAWVHARRLARPRWLPEGVVGDVVAAVVPVGVATGCFEALPFTDAAVLVAALLVAVVVAVRLSHLSTDAFWAWWLPGASAGLLAAIIVRAIDTPPLGADGLNRVAIAALLVGAVAVCSTGPAAPRVWLTAASWATAGIIAADAADLGLVETAFTFALVGAALVLTAAFVRRPAVGHVGWVGHLATIAATGAVIGHEGPLPVAVGALFATGWLITTVAQETAGSPVTDTLEHIAPRHGGALAPVLALVSFPLVAITALAEAGVLEGDPSTRASVSCAVAGVVYAGLARILVERARLTMIMARAAFVFALLGAVAGIDDTAALACSSLAVITVLLLPAVRRGRVMVWVGWGLTALVVGRLAFFVGLDRDAVRIALFGWGTFATIGALEFRRRRGPSSPDAAPRFTQPWAPPALLGFVVILATVVLGVVESSGRSSAGWWLFAAGALTLAWAVELPEPAVTYPTYSLAAAAAALLLPWRPPDDPTGLFLVAVALAAVAFALTLLLPGPDAVWWRGWAPIPLAIGTGVAGFVVGCAELTPDPWVVYTAVGVWTLTVAVWRRHWAWFAAGVVLLDVGAGRAGPGWLALGLGASAVFATLGALRMRPPGRPVLQAVGAGCALGAYASAGWWLNVSVPSAVAVGAPLVMVPVVTLAALVRVRKVALDWLAVWSTAGAAALLLAADLASWYPPGRAGVGVAVGLALAAGACALAAEPVGLPWLREVGATTLAGAAAILGWSLGIDAAGAAIAASVAGLVATVLAATLAWRRPAAPWLRPALLFAGIASVTAVGIGVSQMPDRELLVLALTLAGLEVALVGTVLQRLEVTACGPVLLLAAWLVFASDALTGNPEWFTIPIGVTILVVEGFLRASLRNRGLSVRRPELATIDLAGMAFVVGAALAQTVADDLAYGLVAISLGVALTVWGAVTQVRRRALFGTGSVLAAIVAMLALPLADVVPRLTGASLWITIAGLGLLALLVAAFLEQGRRRVRAAIERLGDVTADWE